MNAITDFSFPSYDNVLGRSLSLDAVRERAPAVFAPAAHDRLSERYAFIPTERVLAGPMSAGFVPVEARQTRARRATPLHARHSLRLRLRFETVELNDSVPEIVFLNSHDGSSAYQLRMGIFRVVCANGLIVSRGAFPAYYVSHRGNVIDQVVETAVRMAERFDVLAAQVERMEQQRMLKDDQIAFAPRALALRFPEPSESGIQPAQLLTCKRGRGRWR